MRSTAPAVRTRCSGAAAESEGNDWLAGGRGDDILICGLGDDTFHFGPAFGNDVITDFQAGAGSQDVIEMQLFGFQSFDDVLAHSAQTGADTVITVDALDTITLSGVALVDLHQDDFVFI